MSSNQITMSLKPFGSMVSSLFKASGFQVSAEPLVHAAMGIIGELMEVASAQTPENFFEECGDAEFYIEAYLQHLEAVHSPVLVRATMNLAIEQAISSWDHSIKGHDLIIHCALIAADLLDLTKKVWVYSQPIEMHISALAYLLGTLHGRIGIMYAERNIEREKVLTFNQLKLAKRYPEGVYTDSAAAARADKAEEAGETPIAIGEPEDVAGEANA